jgi:electron transfer flavoprotein beta subunit
MNIIVCTKAVPGFIQNPRVPKTHDRVDYEPGSIVINESDDYALEAGIKLAKKTGGKTTVLTAGTLSSQKVLQAGLGKDADRAIRIDVDLFQPAKIAQMLALTIKRQDFDLIITGVESRDNMAAQVGVSVAELLGLPFAYAVTEMEEGDNPKTIRIIKELGFGKKQMEELTLPALVCFQTGTEPPGFVPFRKMMMAQSKPIEKIAPSDLVLEERSSQPESIKLVAISPPKETSMAEIIPGDPAQQAATIMKKIREVT